MCILTFLQPTMKQTSRACSVSASSASRRVLIANNPRPSPADRSESGAFSLLEVQTLIYVIFHNGIVTCLVGGQSQKMQSGWYANGFTKQVMQSVWLQQYLWSKSGDRAGLVERPWELHCMWHKCMAYELWCKWEDVAMCLERQDWWRKRGCFPV